MLPTLLTTLIFLLTTAIATPLKRTNTLTPQSILKIAPQTSSCTNPPAPGECRTAVQAAPYISISYTNFNITSFNTQAALLSLMLYESDNFKYSTNHYPGVPGQGTRNMQSPEYNLKYATWLATECENCGMTKAEVERAQAQGPRDVLALVNSDEWGFGSAAWFLSTQCDGSARQGLEGGSEEGWENYLEDCVGTTATEERTEVWRKALALKGW